jgi:hypothetical protein
MPLLRRLQFCVLLATCFMFLMINLYVYTVSVIRRAKSVAVDVRKKIKWMMAASEILLFLSSSELSHNESAIFMKEMITHSSQSALNALGNLFSHLFSSFFRASVVDLVDNITSRIHS